MSSGGSTTPSMLPHSTAASTATLVDEGTKPEAEGDVLTRGQVVGRYVILERVGAGGMGVVYAAYDRDLDRRVAIKILHLHRSPNRSQGPARLVREAQAMARLAHPNVVAVHEVDTWHDNPFVAMEFVDGQTLGEWLEAEPRSWREVVAMLLQAGRGLSAAHQQGLVHRDFKPDNVLIGNDGRARVVDFGLARASSDPSPDASISSDASSAPDSVSLRLTQTGALAGTPAYMGPEQFRGAPPDARTDQFAFCITLWEALYGERPFHGKTRAQLAMAVCKGQLRDPPPRDVPAFLRRALRRGLQLDPDDRFPTMDALLDALDRDPGRTRRRVLAIGVAAASIATLSAITARWAGTEPDPCAGGQDRMLAAWDDPRRVAMHDAFARVDAEFAAASLETVRREIDAYAERWQHDYRDACEATHVRHEQSTEMLDRRMACLNDRLGALEATTGLLAEADRDAVAHSINAVNALPSLDECARPEHLMARSAVPSDPSVAAEVEQLRATLAHASALGLTGRAGEGLAEARLAHERALALDYPPLHAEAALELGQLALAAGQPHEALERLRDAVHEAIATGHDEALVGAATRLVSVVGVSLSRYDEAEQWGRLADAAVRRRGRDPADAIALDRSLCMMLADKGDPAAALSHCREALELSITHYGPDHFLTCVAHRGLGNAHYVAGDYDAAKADYDRAIELFLDSHGIDHPEYPNLLNSLAAVCYSQGRGAACLGLFEETVEAAVRSYGPEHPAVADFDNNLAIVLLGEGRVDEAEARARRSLELRVARFGDDHPGVGAAHSTLSRIAQRRGDEAGARFHADRALEILRATRGDDHPDVLAALQARAEIRLAHGDVDPAIDDLHDALAMAERIARPPVELATIRFALARALHEHRPTERGRARALMVEAETEAGATGSLADEIASWRATVEPPAN